MKKHHLFISLLMWQMTATIFLVVAIMRDSLPSIPILFFITIILWMFCSISTKLLLGIGFLDDEDELDEEIKLYTLSIYGRKNLRKLKRFFSETGFSKVLLLRVDHYDNTAGGYFTNDLGRPEIYISAGALNKLTIGGLKALTWHEVGHYIHEDMGEKYTIAKAFEYCGLTFIRNIMFRFREFYADKYAYEHCGSLSIQLFVIFSLENVRIIRENESYPNFFSIGFSTTHPSPSQRLFFLRNKYAMDLTTMAKLILPCSREY